MIVLSLFDGMGCGRIALERAGIPVTKYYAAEIDKYAIKVAQANYPDIVQLGDVTCLSVCPPIDLLMAGSPCQGFSFAGKQLAFDDPRSKLFFEFIRILKQCKPKKFLLENVVMSQESNDVISSMLGELYPDCITQKQFFKAGRLEPIQINSALVSAQNRERLYWTNIEDVGQPKDRGIILEDVLECGSNTVIQRGRGKNKGGVKKDKSPTVTSSRYEQNVKVGRVIGRKINEDGKRDDDNKDIKRTRRIETRSDEKSGTLTTVALDNVVVKIPVIKDHGELIYKPHKSQCLDANYFKGPDNHGQRTGCIEVGHAEGVKGFDILKRVYSPKGKSPTLESNSGGNRQKKIAVDASRWRKLTCIECERLQTVPDNYTNHVSNTQRYKMLGNGWTVDVIVHFLRNMI